MTRRSFHRKIAPASLFLLLAALSLAGCASAPFTAPDPHHVEAQKQADEKVHAFADNLNDALDKVDRERLLASAGKKPFVTVVSPAPPKTAIPIESAIAPKPAIQPASQPAFNAVAQATTPPESPPASAPTSVPPPVETVNVVNLDPVPSPAPAPTSAPAPKPTPTTAPAENITIIPAFVPEIPEGSLESAIALLRRNAAANPTLATTLALSLLDTTPKSAELTKDLSPNDQQVLADLLGAFQSMTAAAKPGESLADHAAPLIEAAKRWQAEADLALPRVLLASRVDSFGVFTSLPPKFSQGKKHTVILYCEVANFAAKKTDDGSFTISLTHQQSLITEDGLLVWRPTTEDIDDKSLNQRHDFYLVKKITLPETLAAGKYILRMSVTDRNANKIAVVNLPIEITK